MKYYLPLKYLLLFCLTAACIAFPTAVGFLYADGTLTWLCAGFSALTLTLCLLAVKNSEHYIRQVVIRLSDLLAAITSLKQESVFPDAEDTLLSRLQTQTLRLTGILRAQQQDARKKESEIKTLVSDISHQLKTPVAALKMYGELLSDQTISAKERQEYLETLMVSLEKLEFLMDSLIKLSRLESRIIQLKPEPTPVGQTVLEALRQCAGAAKEKNLEVTLQEAEQRTALLDPRWTCEAIFNVLDNAVKYTPEGGSIRIRIQSYEMFCRIDISDTGPGIPPQEEEKIFQRFYRGSASREQDGLGIGLYLSRGIISRQGGYIKLVPQKEGSRFSLFLPL